MADQPTAAVDALCRRHDLRLVELLPGRPGGSAFVARVRDRAGRELVLKQTAPGVGTTEVGVLRLLSGHGLTPPFVAELEPGLYLAEWVAATPLAAAPLEEPAPAAEIGRVLRRLHDQPPPADLPSTRDRFAAGRCEDWRALDPELRALGERLAARLRERHPAREALLHGDLVPTNVLLTARGPCLIDPVGRRGLAAWDLAQLAVAAEGRGRRGLLAGMLAGYGSPAPLLHEMAAWMVLFYLDKNLAAAASPFTPRLQALATALADHGDAVPFVERCLL